MIGSRAEAMRLFRTVANLHPLQIATRVPHLAVARALAFMPRVFAPRTRAPFPRAHPALEHLAEAERVRGRARLAHLPTGGRLREYEAAYGLEVGVGHQPDRDAWKHRVALEPYPASVRARRLAVAIRLGAKGLAGELARACRAVIVQPEFHLLANHLLENGFALVCGGAVTSGPEAEAWFRAGAAILDWQLPEQFLSDGGHFERTASSHVALTYALLETISLSQATGRKVPDAWSRIARRALEWMDTVRAPDGTYPLFNDAALDAAPCIDDVRALGVALDLAKSPAPHEAPRLRSGVEGIAGNENENTRPRAVHLPQTGWVILRGDDAMLAFDAGADGARYQPGHVHADALTIELWIGRERVIVDYGVASYANDEPRAVSRATRSHNTVEIEGHDSSEVWSAFRVGRRARASLHELREHREGQKPDGKRILLAEASHDGYAFLPGGPVHTRRVSLREGELHVSDQIAVDAEARGDEQGALVAVGRMRLDEARRGALGVQVENDAAPIPSHHDVWFPEHGVSRPAEVFEQRVFASARAVQSWRVRW